jgi:hypothetical protein
MLRTILLAFTLSVPLLTAIPFNLQAQSYSVELTKQQTEKLADLIWQNEGAGKKEYLTVWNKNETFPSLGIGHFIWYPTEQKGAFKEQFPQLLAYLKDNNVKLPTWLTTAKVAPWKSKDDFYRDFDKPQLNELRNLLASTVGLQAKFIIQRLEAGIPQILNNSEPAQQKQITQQLTALTGTPEGTFVLLDYINFKGEGISPKERYKGEGWGLKQVLLTMPEKTDNVLNSFAVAADTVLTRRVANAPRDESAWLKGWRVRVHKYATLKI